ncbi:hypothetical protein J7E63_21655 [Bacillus sp. ISL-75]|uniref:hypothetical protein n=1 Tax=Bacillus sp. ISL-75 TaxID=2819137 RepID=UPI001BE9E982|nr:hypothetical protein [Bacillus sp. ISL-75]MBT2729502.1 hypothetical protein [Bacillus sp. ISL-75]
MNSIKSLAIFEQLKQQGKGYFIITDTANPTKIHHVTCSFVSSNNFKTKVIDNNNKNGEYYWIEQWKSSSVKNETPCKKCLE